MATPVFCCGLECGVAGTTGQHITMSGAQAGFDTSVFRTGARSLGISVNSTTSVYGQWTTPASFTRLIGRIYIRVTALPTQNCVLVMSGTDGAGPNVRYDTGKGIVAAVGSSVSASGVAISIDTWYRIDFDFNINTGGNDSCDVRVNGTAATQVTGTGQSASQTVFRTGVMSHAGSQTLVANYDDLLYSHTGADYPLGPGYVKSYIPNADGTHNVAGTNDFERSGSGTDILNSTTDAYQLVDDRPLKSGAPDTEFINMIAPPNATDYVELQFEDSSEANAPRTIEVIAKVAQAATGTGNMELRLNDNGTMGTIYTATGVAGIVNGKYVRAHFADPPSAASAWVQGGAGDGDFNDLRVRFGSPAALDVNPDQYLVSIMIEAEFIPPATFAADAFRFYKNDGDEDGSTPYAAENTNVSAFPVNGASPIIHLRYRVQETAGIDGLATDDFKLQASVNGGAYSDLGSEPVHVGGSTFLTDGDPTTDRATNGISAGTGSFVAGKLDEANGIVDNLQLTANNYTEILFVVFINSSTANNGMTVDFRLQVNGVTITNSVTPRITLSKQIQLVISGSGTGSSFDTNSGTPTANMLQVLFVINQPGTLPTVTGWGLTWYQIATIGDSDSGYVLNTRITVFAARGPAPSAGVLTLAFGGVSQTDVGYQVYEVIDTAYNFILQTASNFSLVNVSNLTVTFSRAFVRSVHYTFFFSGLESGQSVSYNDTDVETMGNPGGGLATAIAFKGQELNSLQVNYLSVANEALAMMIEIGVIETILNGRPYGVSGHRQMMQLLPL